MEQSFKGRWPAIFGLLSVAYGIFRGVMDTIGYIDLVIAHETSQEKTWLGRLLHVLIAPPPWTAFVGVVFGVLLIWWDLRRQRLIHVHHKDVQGEANVLATLQPSPIPQPRAGDLHITASSFRAGDGGERGSGGDLNIRGGDAIAPPEVRWNPDWPIRNLFIHIAPAILENRTQFDDVAHKIEDRFSTGELQCWGREIDHSDRLPLARIDAGKWQHLKLYPWLLDIDGGKVLQADRRKALSPVSQYTDLMVNRSQALSIWLPRPVARDVKLKEALTYAATGKWGLEPMTDDGTGGSISQVGEALEQFQQLARDGALRVWGKADTWRVYDPIPPEYWSDHRVKFLSLFREEATIEHPSSFPHYQDLMVSRTEFETHWPHA